jgi:hypothetical protein
LYLRLFFGKQDKKSTQVGAEGISRPRLRFGSASTTFFSICFSERSVLNVFD